ncbi:hypothetical protein QE152_g326 [Popillia japonica]|uniref:Uncharacterized protein n=1 Tax=Popillia japonica TaxID=7064 RepID=A0AAW1NCD0_POPJA
MQCREKTIRITAGGLDIEYSILLSLKLMQCREKTIRITAGGLDIEYSILLRRFFDIVDSWGNTVLIKWVTDNVKKQHLFELYNLPHLPTKTSHQPAHYNLLLAHHKLLEDIPSTSTLQPIASTSQAAPLQRDLPFSLLPPKMATPYPKVQISGNVTKKVDEKGNTLKF